MNNFDIELIDVSDGVENFQFHGLSQTDLEKVISQLKDNEPFLDFKSIEGSILLKTEFFRGIMYSSHKKLKKTTMQENMEHAKTIGKVKIKKAKNKVFMVEET